MKFESTTTSRDLSTPTRRTSYKCIPEPRDSSEKRRGEYSTSSSPTNTPTRFSSEVPTQFFDKPEKTASASTDAAPDVEAQFELYGTTKRSWKQKISASIVKLVIIFLSLCIIIGVLVLTDSALPTLLRSYHKVKTMGAELANTKFEIEGLKAQVAALYQRVSYMVPFPKLGEQTAFNVSSTAA